ncbi:MAG TPA: hypothetical protein PKC39_08480 [Ferruginibacter sp.]|nr:hypothetical protein [Ferruginibacter sp.]HMP20979.1 hypothetical protein [Ferruginibacter sp.]
MPNPGTPLIKKLGIKDNDRLLLHTPEAYPLWLGRDIRKQLCRKNEKPDFVHVFAANYKSFEKSMQQVLPVIKPGTIIWVSWYKKSSGMATDISETDIRNYALQHDLVDIKVCAVTEQWSGLKLVIPLAKR